MEPPDSWKEKIKTQIRTLGPVAGIKAFVDQLQISKPYNPLHQLHINYDHDQARFDNLPSHWQKAQQHFGLPLHLCPKTTISFPGSVYVNKTTIKSGSIDSSLDITDHTSNQHISDKVKKIIFPLSKLKSFSSVPSYPEEALNVDKSSLRAFPETIKVPVILGLLLERFVELDGLSAEGVFRLAPDGQECAKIKSLINSGQVKQALSTSRDVHIFANLIKQFFRDLDPCLLKNLSPEEIMKLNLDEFNPEAFLTKLNKNEYDSIVWLLELLANVALRKDINRMSSKNLAIVLAPNLYTRSLVDDQAPELPAASANALILSQKVASIVHLLLDYVLSKYP
eukprot:augustus_masked-scaffold_1-processed-gene-29.67-mRNA-1 protein AED:0.38 eAED:0.44 QI:0/-1/0/1/-1/1/1/0/338